MPRCLDFVTWDLVGEGSLNRIYKCRDRSGTVYAFHMNMRLCDMLESVYEEMVLTIHMSYIGIGPIVYDAFFAPCKQYGS